MVSAGAIYPPTKALYNGVINAISGSRGSGIVAAKSGYHSSRAYNRAYHPGDYSIRNSIDQLGPGDGAAAIDVSMSTSNMIKYTKIMIAAMKRGDPRVQSVKEIIGTVDGRNVVRYTRNSRGATPVWASSDSSHLWHQHYSLFRADINDWNKLKGIIEVLGGPVPTNVSSGPVSSGGSTSGSTSSGSSGSSTSGSGGVLSMLGLSKGDSGSRVELLQRILTNAGFPCGELDGDYGPKTAAAVLKMRKSVGSTATDGNNMTPSATEQLLRVYSKKY